MKKMLQQLPFARNIISGFAVRDGARNKLLEILPTHACGAEIGVHLGDFSSEILRVARPRRLFLIDPWKYEPSDEYNQAWYGGTSGMQQEMEQRYHSVQARFAAEVASGRIVIIRSDSASALEDLEDQSLDFVYIDGNHLYEYVKQDLEISLQKVRPGGYITGDDYTPGGWWEGGVKRAVDEFGWNSKVELLWINSGQFVLQRR